MRSVSTWQPSRRAATTPTNSGLYHLYIDNSTNTIGLSNDVTATATLSCAALTTNAWHVVESAAAIPSAGNGRASVYLDGSLISWPAGSPPTCTSPVTSLSQNFGSTPVGQLIVGDTQSSGHTFDAVFDDVSVGSSYIGPLSGPTTGTVSGTVTSASTGQTLSGATVTDSGFDYIFIVVEENKSYGEIIGGAAPIPWTGNELPWV